MRPPILNHRVWLTIGALSLLPQPATAQGEPPQEEPEEFEAPPAEAAPDETPPPSATPEAPLTAEDGTPLEEFEFAPIPEEGAASAQDEPEPNRELGVVYVVAPPEEVARVSGSAHVVDEEELEKFENDDVHRVLLKVPGVYIRGEDGLGLRPNIGLRGANSDRSKKVALMEDGVLFGPAPYSAPAAYYFPLTTRMVAVQVYKGAPSIQYGPNTIGGAVNMVTAPIPDGSAGKLDLAFGQYEYGKLHARYGASGRNMGYLIEGVHLQTSGFKELDGGGDTGFNKNEAMLKWRINSDPGPGSYHQLQIKLGASTEASNETYLGLADVDFEANPYRRYLASSKDHMRWYRGQWEAEYLFSPSEDIEIRTTAYRHEFTRSWRKVNRFAGAEIQDILQDPDSPANRIFYEVLTGEQDAIGGPDTLELGTNRRTYVSQGIQTHARLEFTGESISQTINGGIRFHHDRIRRRHSEDGFLMQSQQLESDGTPEAITTLNTGSTHALAVHVFDDIAWKDFVLSPGARAEFIWTNFEDDQNSDASNKAFQSVFIPGLGAWYALSEHFGVLAGVHQGFSPVSPQPKRSSDDPEPEKAINYEAGVRYLAEEGNAEVVGFFNDYSNLTGDCTFSSGCAENRLDEQFNGGSVHVYGVESALNYTFLQKNPIHFPTTAAYTLTLTEFQTDFSSDNPQFGNVEAGDELPYVPRHQGSVTLGVAGERWGLNASGTYVSEMREVAGQGSIPESESTDAHFVLDVAGNYLLTSALKLYAKLDNALDTDYIASRRPFGARPGKHRWAQIGLNYEF